MNTTVRGVIFDIDGTLVDSNLQHTLAWWKALQEHGLHVPMFEIHRRIGMGSDKLLEDLIGKYSDELGAARARHFEPFRSELAAFPGASDLLRAVRADGNLVVLATSANKVDLEALLKVIDADDAINHVTSAEEVEESKPSPDVFKRALEISGLSPDEAIVVGDTRWDIEAAHRCGLDCVGVESGGWSRLDLLDVGAVAVYRSVQELLNHGRESPLLLRSGTGR